MCPFSCDVCGKFISIEDLTSGNAIRYMATPDSDVSVESFETLCKEHATFTCAVHDIEFMLSEGCPMCRLEEEN